MYVFFVLLCCVSQVLLSESENSFSIQHGIDISLLDLTTASEHVQDLPQSGCVISCTTKPGCVSIIFNTDTQDCYLFNSNQNVQSLFGSSAVYMESRCQAYYTDENCCLGVPNTACLSGHVPVYKDCQQAFENGETQSGVFYLRPSNHYQRVRAWCDFDGIQGWTVIQRRLDGSVDFYRGWDSYVEGFGYVDTEYWFGLENIYYMTRENQKLSIFLEAHDGETRTANYSTFYIDGANVNYILRVSGFSGDAGDSFTGSHVHNGRAFTTYDADHDHSGSNCASKYKGGWWYYSCHHSNLNGIWYAGGSTSSFATGTSWYSWKGHYYSFKTIVMRVGR